MSTSVKLILSSFILLAAQYIILPALIYCNAESLEFSLWMTLAMANLIGQPLIIGSCIHYYFTQKISYPYWITLLLIVNIILYLLPILIVCCFVFSDPIDFSLH